MVQKIKKPPSPANSRAAKPEAVAPKRRGRPRTYEPEVALGKALDLFRKDGFAATSLDDLSAATGMNRPSLYGAFGDKHDLYVRTLTDYWEAGRSTMAKVLGSDRPLREAIRRVYAKALDFYFPEDGPPRGCFAITTATTEALRDEQVRAALNT